jgi:hypothetical protein
MARRPFSSVSNLCLVIGIFFTVAATPAWSEDAQLNADASFDEFARTWIDTVNEQSVPAHPAAMIDDTGAQSGVVTVRKYGNGFTTELRETGREGAEYVGILQYDESIYNYREDNVDNCSKPATGAVTEIFRYDDGSWIY